MIIKNWHVWSIWKHSRRPQELMFSCASEEEAREYVVGDEDQFTYVFDPMGDGTVWNTDDDREWK